MGGMVHIDSYKAIRPWPGLQIIRYPIPVTLRSAPGSKVFEPKPCSCALIQDARDRSNQVQYLARVAVHAIDIVADTVVGLVAIEPVPPRIADDPAISENDISTAVLAGLARRHARRVFLNQTGWAIGCFVRTA